MQYYVEPAVCTEYRPTVVICWNNVTCGKTCSDTAGHRLLVYNFFANMAIQSSTFELRVTGFCLQ
jgi:hypothetical protein